MRIVWHSNAGWNNSGYGIQTALFVPRLAALGHDLIVAAPYSFSGAPLEWKGFTVLPCARDQAGNDTITANHEYFEADWTITLADPFGLLKVARAGTLAGIGVAHWFPVDCAPLAIGDVTVLREGRGFPIAMSRFGQRVLADEGAEPGYVPLAVDTDVFKPGDGRPYRETLPGVTDDTFVIGICAMNRDLQRKGWSEQLLAFSRFHARHPDSFLAIHTSPHSQPGLNLNAMAASLGITTATGFPDSYSYDMGLVAPGQMAAWYNGLDVLSACSYAEGFGLPLLEAQACGIPVVTTDASATAELCGAGWLVSGTPWWTDGHAAWWVRPDAGDIGSAYESAWQARENGMLPEKHAREFALLYDADRVTETYWKPVLSELEARLG
jgi:glycosyltransferase involved in cell wall biosynthesis